MPRCDAVTTQAALMEAALRLVDDRDDVPAGSVLRCFSRAVAVTRRSGIATEALPTRAEALARGMLAARNGPDRNRLRGSATSSPAWPEQWAASA